MKTKTKELDVDFIGGQEPLTLEEENAISDFFKKQKHLRNQKQIRKSRSKVSA